VPIVESLNLLSQHFSEDILALFRHFLTSTYFLLVSSSTSQQVAMVSPLCPVIANFFMEDSEAMALGQATHELLCLSHYVSDTFVIWPNRTEKPERFLDHLNGLHRNIQFTMEMERDGHLPFLDFNMYRRWEGSLGHRVYQKPTHTNVCLVPGSHHPSSNIQCIL